MIKFTSIFAVIYGRVNHNRSGEIKILWTLKEGSFLNISVGHSHSYFLLGLINLPESAESIFLGYPTVSANPSPHSSVFFFFSMGDDLPVGDSPLYVYTYL